MDSELTLVNLPPPTSYFLSSTDLKDAVIYAHPGAPLYKIVSDTKYIKVYGGSALNRTIAVLHRRELFADTIFFPQRQGNGSPGTVNGMHVTIQRWLKRFKLADGTFAFTIDTEYGPYVWKSISRYRQKVFAGYDLENPVASYYLHQTLPPGKPAFVLHPTGEPIRDDIVVAYLVQRHRVAMESKALELFVGPS